MRGFWKQDNSLLWVKDTNLILWIIQSNSTFFYFAICSEDKSISESRITYP